MIAVLVQKERDLCWKLFISVVLGCVCPSQISISIKILGYEDIEENSGCRYQMEQSRGGKNYIKTFHTGHEEGTREESKSFSKQRIFFQISFLG